MIALIIFSLVLPVQSHVLYGIKASNKLYSEYTKDVRFRLALNETYTRIEKSVAERYSIFESITINKTGFSLYKQEEIIKGVQFVNEYFLTFNKTDRVNITFVFSNLPLDGEYTLLGTAEIIDNVQNNGLITLYPMSLNEISTFVVVVHELLHILGFGTQPWQELLIRTTPTFVSYNGTLANVYARGVPLQVYSNTNVQLSQLSHWSPKSDILKNDIMQPVINEPSISSISMVVPMDTHTEWEHFACETNDNCPPEMSCFRPTNDLPGKCLEYTSTRSYPVSSISLCILSGVSSIIYVLCIFECYKRQHADSSVDIFA